jgi:flagellar basal-body rod protein FlgB
LQIIRRDFLEQESSVLQDITQSILAKALDGSALRNRAISNNIANVETPNYQRQDVSFEDELRSALDSSTSSARQDGTAETPSSFTSLEAKVAEAQPRMMTDSVQPARDNGNNVDVDREMARLAENTIHYEALLQTVSVKSSMLKNAIYEGRR